MTTETLLRSRLLTLFTLLGASVALPNVLFFFHQQPAAWYTTLAYLLASVVVLLFKRKNFYLAAGLLLFISADVYVFVTASSFGREAAEQWLYLPILFGAVLLFNESLRALAFTLLFTLACLLALELTNYQVFASATPGDAGSQYMGNLIAAFGLSTVAAIFYYHLYNKQKHHYESRLRLKADSEATINYLATSLHGKNTVDEILWDITQNCVAQLGFADCVIYVLDHDRQVLVQRAAFGSKSNAPKEIAQQLEIPVGKGIVGSVAESGVGEIVADTSKDSRYIVDDEARLSELSVPIFLNGRVFGVIDSEHPRKNFFTVDHLNILTTLSALAANKITKAQADEDQIKSAVIQLEAEKIRELDKLKSRFFSNISHEFRTPLTMIMGPLADLVRNSTNEELRKQYLLMQENGNLLLSLINDLLELSRLDEGILKLNKTNEDINHFLRAITESFPSQAKAAGVQFTSQIGAGGLSLSFDMAKMETILVNMISGILRLTPAGATVHIETAYEKEWFRIRISQNSSTLPSDVMARILDRTTSPSEMELYQGVGIGMQLAAQLISLHAGRLTYEINEGIHQFTISFALESMPEEQLVTAEVTPPDERAPRAILDSGHINRKPSVLLVEDNNDLRRYLRKVLEGDFQIAEADNGAAGWDLASSEIPDLIISDVMMPIKDGYELCLDIKGHEVTNHIPVILLTAKADLESRLEGLKTGADYYLAKPFEPLELTTAANNLIEQRKKLRNHFSKKILVQSQEWQGASADERFLARLMAFVEKNIPEPDFSVEDLQREMGVSRMQLHRKLKALTDQSATEFIRTVRLKRAAEMLQKGHDNVSQVAYQVGFSSLSYFTKCFKELYGHLPSEMAAKAAHH